MSELPNDVGPTSAPASTPEPSETGTTPGLLGQLINSVIQSDLEVESDEVKGGGQAEMG